MPTPVCLLIDDAEPDFTVGIGKGNVVLGPQGVTPVAGPAGKLFMGHLDGEDESYSLVNESEVKHGL